MLVVRLSFLAIVVRNFAVYVKYALGHTYVFVLNMYYFYICVRFIF